MPLCCGPQLLHSVLKLEGPAEAPTPSDMSDSGSQDRAHKAALDEATRNAKKVRTPSP